MHIKWRGLDIPTRVEVERETLTDTFGKFVIEPFMRGFGTTIGNSLRRVLISSLEGSAITRVKFQGVYHELTTLPGVVEDVTDIILNLKGVALRNHSDQPRTLKIEKHERGVVTAADIIPDEAVEIFNPDHIIATLTDDVPFVVEMTVENGRGFSPASERMQKEQELGVIPLDAAFSPVQRVEYHVEDTRVGHKVNYDKLTIKIWTDGTVSPEMALVEAAKILRKHLNPFVQYFESGPEMPIEEKPGRTFEVPAIDPDLQAKLDMSLAELELSVRATNCLEQEGITTVRDLVTRTKDELLQIRNFGEQTLKEVEKKLEEIGLQLGQLAESVDAS